MFTSHDVHHSGEEKKSQDAKSGEYGGGGGGVIKDGHLVFCQKFLYEERCMCRSIVVMQDLGISFHKSGLTRRIRSILWGDVLVVH